MRNRNKSSFIILPVYCRTKETLIPIIEKYITKGSIIYSDSFSVYVNNYTKPKSSHLTSLGYAVPGNSRDIARGTDSKKKLTGFFTFKPAFLGSDRF